MKKNYTFEYEGDKVSAKGYSEKQARAVAAMKFIKGGGFSFAEAQRVMKSFREHAKPVN